MLVRLARCFHKSPLCMKLQTFIIPQPGEGIAEVEIIRWLVKPNEKVKEFDILCEARSDKGFIEYKSPFTGVLKELMYKSSEMAQIGSPLFKIDVDGEPSSEPTANIKTPEPQIESEEEESSGAYIKKAKVLTTPYIRGLAKKHKLDLTKVAPTGKDGRILKEDVLKIIEGAQQPEIPAPIIDDPKHINPPILSKTISAPEDKIMKLTPVQRGMVKSMTQALKIPHLTYSEDVYMDEIIALRSQLKANLKDIKLTFMPFFIKALSLALLDFPIVNSVFNENTSECIYKASHNVSIAMDSPFGLIVPNIKDVQNKSIFEVAKDMNRLQDLGGKGKLTDNDLKNGTIALSNIGSIGGTYVAPVIMPPQVFIGAFGATRPRLEKKSSEIVEKQILATSWSADHRIIDGATTARFVARWKALIENPSIMLLHLK